MLHAIDDCAKRRLTERVDILTAINILKSRGYDEEQLVSEITKIFYVDLDEYNEIIRHSWAVRATPRPNGQNHPRPAPAAGRMLTTPRRRLAYDQVAQPCEYPGPRVYSGADVPGGGSRGDGFPEMAIANDSVQLPIRQFEEPFGFAIAVVLQAFGAKDRIVERHRQRRAGTAHRRAGPAGLVFRAVKRCEPPLGSLFEKSHPAFEALPPRHCGASEVRMDLGDGFEVF
jgi:hypothetical protein